MVKMSAIGIALCVYLQFMQSTSALNFRIGEHRKGIKLSITSVFRTQIQNTLASCQKSCIATASCEAFTYNLRDLRCLYGSTGSEFESTTDLDYVTSPSQWTPEDNENLIHPCAHRTCQKGSECYVMKNGNAVCIKTECTESPWLSVANSTTLSLERTVGRTVGIVCNDGFIINGNQQRTCKGNGQWTGVNTTTCIECANVTHYTTYETAIHHCLSEGKGLLQYGHRTPALRNVTQGRCKTCPSDLVAYLHKRYLDADCTTGYTNNLNCTCHFTTAAPDMKIAIATEFLDLETNYDFLYIFDGENATYPILGSYTGTTPFALVTTGTDAFMALKTDHLFVNSGFRLSYRMVPPDVASDTPSSLNLGDIPRYLWLDGYLDAKNHQFQLPNGEVVSMSTLTLDAAAKLSRLCYDPVFDQLKAFDDTDYCNTYCETL
ncbi:uncharacterized protein LOC110446585 [Mizuhopecten yessoensis]|uniref:uncharacterized protein LOC110446585 n=1 Tax=Mizuhopecten yessoensis TaxID=6573 RepID=UPI000B45B9DF|nr:uncharacterized protein LOC110446585 [Mizuhopecten yessoensis]